MKHWYLVASKFGRDDSLKRFVTYGKKHEIIDSHEMHGGKIFAISRIGVKTAKEMRHYIWKEKKGDE